MTHILGHRLLVIATLLALTIIAVTPLLRAESPCTHDGDLHYFRVVAMRSAMKQGFLFTRWLPDLAFGYGYPFFNYRAPLSYYLALGLWLTGMPLPLALNLVYALSLVGCAVGAYLWARELFGAAGGIVAAMAYAYAPYQFLNALLRGNAPESVALALFPFILWAFRRLALEGRRRWFLAATGFLTALYLTHNISSLTFTPFLAAYLALLGWVYRRRGHWKEVALAMGLALGLTAFLWLPALAEKRYAQLHMSRVTRNNDFHYNFLNLAEILAPPTPFDTSLMNPPMEIHLGLALVILAGIGLVTGWIMTRPHPSPLSAGERRERQRKWGEVELRATLFFSAASAVLFVFMSTRASLWVWENVPLLPFVQFPWRFVGRAVLPLALLASATCTERRATRTVHHLLPLVLCLPIFLSSFPLTYPPFGYCPRAPHPMVLDIHRYEHQSRLVGVDPVGSYFPVWVEERPTGSPLEIQYEAGGPVARFDKTALPNGARVLEANYGPNRACITLRSPSPFTARYLAFFFPGWRVWIDDRPIQIRPTDPDGLIAFDVPAGRHTLVIRFTETPLRTAADLISLISLLALVVAMARLSNNPINQWSNGLMTHPPSHPATQLPSHLVPLLLALLLTLLKAAVVDRTDTIFRRPALRSDGILPGVEHPVSQPYADGMVLIGYDVSATRIPGDGTLRVDLYWTARERPTRPYQTVVHLIGPDGFLWSPQGSIRPRGYQRPLPTDTWEPGRYAIDSHEVELLPGTPPGTYRVVMTLFDQETLQPLSLLNEAGQPAAPSLTLMEVTVARPHRPADPPTRGRLDLPAGPLALLTADFDRDHAAPGDTVRAAFLWRVEGQSTAPFTPTLALLADDGSSAAEFSLAPLVPWFPLVEWRSGEVWRSQHRLTLPAILPSGTYTWTLQVARSSNYPTARLTVAVPPRTFTPPPVGQEVGTHLGDVATLIGFTLNPATCPFCDLRPAAPLTVTLVWRAETTASASYHVFLHLLGPDGRIVAQSDGIPANWTRPTTGWLPGEYIVDPRVLTLPPDALSGTYTLQTGLYLPGDGRLITPDGLDVIRLTEIEVGSP